MKRKMKQILSMGLVAVMLLASVGMIPAMAETTRPDTIMGVSQLYDYDRAVDRKGNDIGGVQYLMFSKASYDDNNGYGEYNYWTRSNDYKIQRGLVEDSLDASGNVVLSNIKMKGKNVQLTTPSSVNGKLFQSEEYKGTYQMPFQYNAKTNRYEYDSQKNNLVANDKTGVLEYASANPDGFFPLGDGNFWYGMTTTLPFVYKNGGKVDGEDMVFEFAGDDDVWVFIDGKLALDLGGIHGAVSGSINFATGQITTVGKYSNSDSSTTKHYTSLSKIGFDFSVAEHTVKIFYLERGSGKANCKMSFNLVQPTNYIVKYYDGAYYDGKPGDKGMIAISVQNARADGTSLYAGDTVTLDEIMIDINDATHALATNPDYYGGFVVDDNFQKVTGDKTVVTTVTEDDSDIVRVIFYPKPSYTVTYWKADAVDTDKSEWSQITQKTILGTVGQSIMLSDIVKDVTFDGVTYEYGKIVTPDENGALGTLNTGAPFNVDVVYYPDRKPEPTPTPTAEPTAPPTVLKNDYAYIFGRSDTEMQADDGMKLGEASAVLYRLLKQNGQLGSYQYDPNKTPVYADLLGRWDRSANEYMAYIGVFDNQDWNDSDYSTLDVLNPDQYVSRDIAFRMFAMALGFTAKKPDAVPEGYYSNLLIEAGFVQGDENGDLHLNDTITRAEFCKIYNMIIGRDSDHYKLETEDGTPVTPETYGFTDVEQGSWYYEIILRATSAFDANGNVDLNARGIRNNLDDYE